MASPDRSHLTVAALHAVFGERPFTIPRAEEAGIGRGRIRAALDRGRVTRIRPGIFTTSSESSQICAIRAALAAYPESVAAYSSALVIHGLPVPYPTDSDVHLILPRGRYRREGHVHFHGSPLKAADIARIDGDPVTSLVRTVIDSARVCSLPRALIPLDAVMRRWCAESMQPNANLRYHVHDEAAREQARARLIAALKDQRGWQGIRAAASAIESADPASESPLESLSRGGLEQFAVPRPACGIPVLGANGVTYWADLGWPTFGVLGECDGLVKYGDQQSLRGEKLRQEALEQNGWIVVRWTWDEMVGDPKKVAARIQRALRRGRRDLTPLPY